MVSDAMGKISRLCLYMFFVMQIHVIFVSPPFLFGTPSFGALSSCPSRLPPYPPLLILTHLVRFRSVPVCCDVLDDISL